MPNVKEFDASVNNKTVQLHDKKRLVFDNDTLRGFLMVSLKSSLFFVEREVEEIQPSLVGLGASVFVEFSSSATRTVSKSKEML